MNCSANDFEFRLLLSHIFLLNTNFRLYVILRFRITKFAQNAKQYILFCIEHCIFLI